MRIEAACSSSGSPPNPGARLEIVPFLADFPCETQSSFLMKSQALELLVFLLSSPVKNLEGVFPLICLAFFFSPPPPNMTPRCLTPVKVVVFAFLLPDATLVLPFHQKHVPYLSQGFSSPFRHDFV